MFNQLASQFRILRMELVVEGNVSRRRQVFSLEEVQSWIRFRVSLQRILFVRGIGLRIALEENSCPKTSRKSVKHGFPKVVNPDRKPIPCFWSTPKDFWGVRRLEANGNHMSRAGRDIRQNPPGHCPAFDSRSDFEPLFKCTQVF